MPRILLIDDDEQLGLPLAAYFKRFELTLEQAVRPSEGLAKLAVGGWDAAILDVMLPEMDGFELCRTIRRQPGALAELPLLMLTARGDVMDRVVGLELGADDYLPKPFEPRELVARLQTILRRRSAPRQVAEATAPVAAEMPLSGHGTSAAGVPGGAPTGRAYAGGIQAPPAVLRFEGLSLDTARRAVIRQGQAVELTGTEYELLLLLARAPGRVFSRDDILSALRGHEADLYTRAVDIVVSRLRRKLEPLDAIKTLRNAGYTLALPVLAP